MSNYDDSHCPICTISELTAATKVYPLCQCKLSICFDCLKRWAETKYCCPFCNIPFTSNALQQTKEDLIIRLRGEVADSMLEEVVTAWVHLLKLMRSGMEVELALLNMESLASNDIAPDISPPLDRSRTPFFPGLHPLRTTSPSLSRSNLSFVRQPNLSNISFNTSFVQPTVSMSSVANPGLYWQGFSATEIKASIHSEAPNPSRNTLNNLGSIQRHVWSTHNSFSQVDQLERRMEIPQGIPATIIRKPDGKILARAANRISDHPSIKLGRLSADIPEPPSIFANMSTRLDEFMMRHSEKVKSVLSKKLHVRELVSIRSGSSLESRLEGNLNRVGVVMKHSGKFQVGAAGDLMLEKNFPVLLTVRLLDGSWLPNVRVEDVESRGKRATLMEYLRVGDILWTRFGVALARRLHPGSGQITAEFRGRFLNPQEFSSFERDEIHEELRQVLFGNDDLKEDERGLIITPFTVENSEISDEEETKEELAINRMTLDQTDSNVKHQIRNNLVPLERQEINISSSDSDFHRTDLNIDVQETKSRIQKTCEDFRKRKDEKMIQADNQFYDIVMPSIGSISVDSKGVKQLKEKIEDPAAFHGDDFVLMKKDTLSLGALPNLPESRKSPHIVDRIKSLESECKLPPRLSIPGISQKMPAASSENIKSIFKIYDTDILTVLSAEEVFTRMEKKVAQELFVTAPTQITKKPRFTGASRHGPPVRNSSTSSGLLRKLSYHDKIIVPVSDGSSTAGTVRNINFGS